MAFFYEGVYVLDKKTREAVKNSKVNIEKDNMQRIIETYALSPCSVKKMAEKFSLSAPRMCKILKDDNVRAEIDKIREEYFEEASMRFKVLANKAVDVVRDAINQDEADVKVALKILEGVGIANPKVITVPIRVEIINPENGASKE